MLITEWRAKFRREMNNLDNQKNTKAVDSVLNFETVSHDKRSSHYDVFERNYVLFCNILFFVPHLIILNKLFNTTRSKFTYFIVNEKYNTN